MEYTEQELFELPNVVVEDDCEIYRFNCTLLVSTNGQNEERVGKRRYFVSEIKDKGYIGFDAYNHNVDASITDRIRITYVGKDYLILFVRTPAKDNKPIMHKVTFDNNRLEIKKDCGNGVVYTLITTIKRRGE